MKPFHHYWIAYREGGKGEFQIIEPPSYGWTADPFLVEYENEIYLFAEIFLYKTERNGKIGYCKYKDGKFGQWHISMDKHWHLSYPNVFVKNGKLYMVPESYQLEEVCLYELVSFPDKWKKVKTYINNVEYCDSTFMEYEGQQYMFTYERCPDRAEDKELLYRLEGGELAEKQVISTNQAGARAAGNIIIDNGKYIRVAQNGVPTYGAGLIFYQIDSVWPEYREHEIKRAYARDFNRSWDDSRYDGCHTYNRLGNLEVIDIIGVREIPEEEIASRRVHEVFLNKYR